MSKVTSKLQITIPKAIADRQGIRPGDEVDWQDAAGAIRLVPPVRRASAVAGRGWTRDELYEDRGRPR